MMEEMKLNSIEEAVEDFKKGEFVIVVDDEDRERRRPDYCGRKDYGREGELHAEERPWCALRTYHHRTL